LRKRLTLAIRNLTGVGAHRILKRQVSKADFVSMTEEQPITEWPRPKPSRRLGLSGKLLLLTIPLVMIAGMLIYVPAIANFRMNRLNDRLAAANTAALVLDAAPSGMVPDSLARQILTSIGARAVAIKMGQQRRLLASAGLPTAIDHDVDVRTMTVWSAIVDSFEIMLETGNQAIRVIGPSTGGGQFIEVVIDEQPLRQAMYRFSRNVLLVALLIAGLTAGLVYLALHYLFVRPMRRLTASLVGFHENPESSARIIAAMRSGLPSANCPTCSVIWCRCCIRRAGSQPLGLRSRRSTTICATCWRPRNCYRTSLPACPIRGCSGSRQN
jgi:hypothetical protein